MENISTKIVGTKLVIEIDTTADLGPSKSGKTRMVASTQGNKTVTGAQGGDLVIGVNAYRRS